MNLIYLILAGVIIIVFWVAQALITLIDKYIQDNNPSKAIYIFVSGTVYFYTALMVFVSMAVTAFWYGFLEGISESLFSITLKYPHYFGESLLIKYLAVFYFFCYLLVSFAVVYFNKLKIK